MMRVTRSVLFILALLAATAAAARAQTPPPSEEGRFYAGIGVGATFGHKSDSSVGVDLSGKLTDQFEVFIEFGRMGNIGTANLDARADVIDAFIRGTHTAVQKATFGDIGLKYRAPAILALPGEWRPYVGIGFGRAKVETLVSFAVNGVDVTADLLGRFGIELGNDLSDSFTKTLIVFPVGIQGRLMKRFVIDGSYRYGRMAARPDDIDSDIAISTQRLQIGFGVRF